MLALEVYLNGKKIALAGAEDLSVLTGVVGATGKLGRKTSGTKANPKGHDLWLSVGGLTSRADGTPDEFPNWVKQKKLKVGDRVVFRVRRVAVADLPEQSSPAASKKLERSRYKFAKAQYMKLRKKYEKPKANKSVKRTR